MQKLFLSWLALALAAPAWAEAPKAFASLRDRAEAIDSLTTFLDRYVGHCNDPFERATCEANARKARESMTGKSFYAILGESASRMLRPGPFNPARREYRIDLTPFFEGGDYALTEGSPIGLDAEGRPRFPLMPLTATMPDDWLPMDMERLLRSGMVRVHLVFTPMGLWSLPAKSGGKVEGVRAKFQAVRLVNGRTGAELALHVAR
jgi:Family of unknown function (DUF6066)